MAAASEVGTVDSSKVVANLDTLGSRLQNKQKQKTTVSTSELQLTYKQQPSSESEANRHMYELPMETYHDGVFADFLNEGVSSTVVRDGKPESWSVFVYL